MRLFWITSISTLLLLIFYTFFKITLFLPNQVLVLVFTVLLFILMLGWEFVYRYNAFLANKFYFRMLAWIGSTLLGFWTTFILFSIIVDVGYLALSSFTNVVHLNLLLTMPNIILSKWVSVIIFMALLQAG